jgi:exodeoxyribonuclease VII large subunit
MSHDRPGDQDARPWDRWLLREAAVTPGDRASATGSGANDGPPGPEPPPIGDLPAAPAPTGVVPAAAPEALDLWANAAPAAADPRRRPDATAGQEREDGTVRPRPTSRAGLQIWTVAELTRAVRDLFRGEERFRELWVEGEVGQVTVSAAGHCYFSLRDGRTQLGCVLFRTQRMAGPFEPQTGLRVVARGRLDVYDAQGTYQLYVESVQPAGFGDLALRFEALKAQLAAEGLFDPAVRRPLPRAPRTIGVVTSETGAVLHDIRHVLARRWPLARVVVSACLVQGDGAPHSIVAALGRIGRWRDPRTGMGADVVILARGGGSLEDLWAFNDERVVRAVRASPVPVVTGVGHETDVTLVDFAADLRAPTPSAAAELVVPSRVEAAGALRAFEARMRAAVGRGLAGPDRTLREERRALDRLHPRAVLAGERVRAGELLDRARRSVELRIRGDAAAVSRWADRLPLLAVARLAASRSSLERAGAGLGALSPYGTLDRGYAIVRSPSGRVLVDANAASPGDSLDVRLARGSLDVNVTRVRDSAAAAQQEET